MFTNILTGHCTSSHQTLLVCNSNDVLFYTNDLVPVACDYEPIFAGGITDYKPTTAAHRAIEKDCQENLPHPDGTRVALVEYEANPDGKFPGYHLVNVTSPNEGSCFREENCLLLFNPLENAAADPRPVILITESSTCHNVLDSNRAKLTVDIENVLEVLTHQSLRSACDLHKSPFSALTALEHNIGCNPFPAHCNCLMLFQAFEVVLILCSISEALSWYH